MIWKESEIYVSRPFAINTLTPDLLIFPSQVYSQHLISRWNENIQFVWCLLF